MQEPSLNEALKDFEAAEANLVKLEKLWQEIKDAIPEGLCFGDPTEGAYDDRRRAFEDVHAGLPKIDGWTMQLHLFELNEIAQMRLDAKEVGDGLSEFYVEEAIYEQGRQICEYRYKLNKKRRHLIRNKVTELIDRVDNSLSALSDVYPNGKDMGKSAVGKDWEDLIQHVSAIDTLLGTSVKRPSKWSDLRRHLHFGLVQDLHDIIKWDWPVVKSSISDTLYSDADPIPVATNDLGALVKSEPKGEVITQLKWAALDDTGFERLLFSLISNSPQYENPEWLTKTKAPDRGRDLSVYRIMEDDLGGTLRQRVIIQCKHWQSRSIDLGEVTTGVNQMKLWEPPKVDILVFASSGRFTSDAVQFIENTNQSDTHLRIEMWPESHLERLLASRSALVAEFGLR